MLTLLIVVSTFLLAIGLTIGYRRVIEIGSQPVVPVNPDLPPEVARKILADRVVVVSAMNKFRNHLEKILEQLGQCDNPPAEVKVALATIRSCLVPLETTSDLTWLQRVCDRPDWRYHFDYGKIDWNAVDWVKLEAAVTEITQAMAKT